MAAQMIQLPVDGWERSYFFPVSSVHSSTTEQDCLCPTGLRPQLAQLSLGRDIPTTPNVSPTEPKPLEFPSQTWSRDPRSPISLKEPSEDFIEHHTSLILNDNCVKDFSNRTQNLLEIFRLSVNAVKPLANCNTEEVLRLAIWWFLHGHMKLEPLIREAPSSPLAEQVNNVLLQQAHVDLAKALWILLETRHSGPQASSLKALEATGTCRESDQAEFPALRLRLLIRLRRAIYAMSRNGLSPQPSESSSVPEDADMSIWIRYPLLNLDMDYLISGYHNPPPQKATNLSLSAAFPLTDTEEAFHYGGMHVDLFLGESANAQEVRSRSILSIIRGVDEKDLSVIIGTQDGLLNLVISSSRQSYIFWDDVTWVASLSSLEVKLRTGFRLQVRCGVWDFQTLKRMYDYCRTTLRSFHPAQDEILVFETDIKSTQYRTNLHSESRIFPTNPVPSCKLRLFEKTAQWPSAIGLRRVHCAFRIAILTPPSYKNLSILSQEQPPSRALQFDFPKGDNAESILSLKIDPEDLDASLVLSFPDSEPRNTLLAHLTGCSLREHEYVLAQVKLNKASFSSGLEAPAPIQSFDEFQWQSLQVITKQPLDADVLTVESSQPVQSESLRIIVDSPKGRITDRVNIGIGELKIRQNVIAYNASGYELHVLRQPQEDLSFSLSNYSTVQSERHASLEADLDILHTQPSIRTYSFPNLSELHLFQSAITGFSILFDGMATSFSISRRRMIIPIHKEWSSPHTRIQVLRRGKVVQLVAFFEGFSHGKAMNFALKQTDVFEKSMKGGKVSLKIADAKFALPTGGKMDAGHEKDFVCLDFLEYPGEHDNIHIGFANDAGE